MRLRRGCPSVWVHLDDERSIVCWQPKAMVHLPEQGITSRFIKGVGEV